MEGGCRWRFTSCAVAIALALLAVPAARAQALHKCVATDGSIAYQDRPCPADSTEWPRPPAAETRGLAPEPGATPVAAPAAVVAVPDPVADTRATPLPSRYRCESADGKRYVSSNPTPRGRYVPLWTLSDWPSIEGRVGAPSPGSRGVGGTTPPPGGPPVGAGGGWPATMAAGYTWVQDRCLAMGRGELCAHWRAEIDRVGAARRIAFQAERATLDGEYSELRQQFATHCR
jgi:hypothetical protein